MFSFPPFDHLPHFSFPSFLLPLFYCPASSPSSPHLSQFSFYLVISFLPSSSLFCSFLISSPSSSPSPISRSLLYFSISLFSLLPSPSPSIFPPLPPSVTATGCNGARNGSQCLISTDSFSSFCRAVYAGKGKGRGATLARRQWMSC